MGVVPTPRSYSIYFVWFNYFFVYIVEKNMKKKLLRLASNLFLFRLTKRLHATVSQFVQNGWSRKPVKALPNGSLVWTFKIDSCYTTSQFAQNM